MKRTGSDDLNALRIDSDQGPMGQSDHSRENDDVTCYFKNVRDHLIRHISEADYIFGCVAWLTDSAILDALAKKRGVCLLVQKEDFLRPDSGGGRFMAERLRKQYSAIRGVERSRFSSGVGHMLSFAHDPTTDPVRCVGIFNSKKASAAPRMHHKFAVFCRKSPPEAEVRAWMLPYAAWTGSFNWSHNASQSLENAVLIRDQKIAKSYYLEFQQVLALSEPLDWTSEWAEPEWRIGT